MRPVADPARRVVPAVLAFLAWDDDWTRPVPRWGRQDVWVGVGLTALCLLSVELARSAGALASVEQPWWVQYAVTAAASGALVWRRQHPVAVALLLSAHMFVVGVTMPALMGQLALQLCYFAGLYAAMAWGPSRRTSTLAVSGVLLFMFGWLAWQFALGSAVDRLVGLDVPDEGFLGSVVGAVGLSLVVNLLYFVGAVVAGQLSWRAARQRSALAEQAETIARQADSLSRRAVVDERLRIARELHDVVGHHVSVIGVQAAGARHVLHRDPAASADALEAIEGSAREAVDQMRGLLGTLRDTGGAQPEDPSRAAGPGLADLPRLAADQDRLAVELDLVESPSPGDPGPGDPDPGAPGRWDVVPAAVQLSLYRIAQEALANVRRHSTASAARVTVRTGAIDGPAAYVELEVLDDGRPRSGSSGSGLGHLGIRERVASHRGMCDIGPRATGGFRVRVRFPVPAAPAGRAAAGTARSRGTEPVDGAGVAR